MLEYIFFHDEPRKQFIQYLLKQDIPYEEQNDSMGMVVAVPEDMGEELEDGKTIYASVSPNVINRVLGVITTQELNDLVNSIVTSVLNPDERPVCTR